MCFCSSKNDYEKYEPPRPSSRYASGYYNSSTGYSQRDYAKRQKKRRANHYAGIAAMSG
ncbi:hypothetical protein BBP40_000551 [Aspergillus hancockii]|nr:hypothetical protein BBP40_000551 [Aspergillus hancockii]